MCVILWNSLLIVVEETMLLLLSFFFILYIYIFRGFVHVVVDRLALAGCSSMLSIISGSAGLKNVREVSHELMEGN